MHESNAILRYLCVKHELSDWHPAHLPARANVEQWLDWNQCRLSPAVVDIVLNSVFLGDKGDRLAIERGQTRLDELMPILEAGLEGKDFLAGERATIADLSLASSIFQLTFANIAPAGTNVERWFRLVSTIPGFRNALPRM